MEGQERDEALGAGSQGDVPAFELQGEPAQQFETDRGDPVREGRSEGKRGEDTPRHRRPSRQRTATVRVLTLELAVRQRGVPGEARQAGKGERREGRHERDQSLEPLHPVPLLNRGRGGCYSGR